MTSTTDTPWWQYLEDAGYTAGLAGRDVHQSEGWGDAWSCPGQNHPMYIIAGWVAGRAVRRFDAEIEERRTTDG